MSGFSADWLRLREAADHRARNPALTDALLSYLRDRETVNLLDFGCGTGSNLRALAPALPMPQHWHLVDHDRALLDAARDEIEDWLSSADLAELTYSLEAADLLANLDSLFSATPCDVLTAAALFDLVSESWMEQLAAKLAQRKCAFYTVLIYNGEMHWTPEHEADEAVRQAFNSHQQTDKGFGAAAGPQAGEILADKLKRAGFKVQLEPSPWRLGLNDRLLMSATAEGIGNAAQETGLVDETAMTSWQLSRASLRSCEIGHLDLLALPA